MDLQALFMFIFVLASLVQQIKRLKSNAETSKLGVACFVLASTKKHQQTTDMLRQICFIVFGCILLFEPLCLSRSWHAGSVCCAGFVRVWIGKDLEMLQADNT